MKNYLATAEICKMYKENYSIDTILLQNEFATKSDAKSWLKKIASRVRANRSKVSLKQGA